MTLPHLIALDLDGTLLNTKKQISKRTKTILNQLKEAGHQLVISTGRPFRASQNYYEELNLTTPIVNFNGAHVHHPRQPDFGVYHTTIPRETAFAIVKTCRAFQINNVITEVLDDVYVDKWDKDLISAFDMPESQITVGPIEQTLRENPTSVLISTPREHISRLIKALDSEHAEIIDQRSWGYPSEIIEIIRKGTNKAVGLKRVADYLSIPMSRVVAFGDEENDLEMLAEAGLGVAMANGSEEVREIANYVTLSNDEDGVAVFLETHFKLEV